MTVDAESWKSALTEARGGKSLSKFRVDFEEDGAVRVHDLVTNERFSLRPTNAALSQSAPESAPTPPPASPEPAAPVAQAPVAQQAPVVPPPSVVPPPNRGSIVPPPGPTGRPSNAGFQAVVPPPANHANPSVPAMVAIVPPPEAPSAPVAAAPVQPTQPVQPALVPSAPSSASLTPSASIPAPAPGADVVVRAPGALFFSRDREAAASNGLTYRERLIAVPPQTSADECTAIARDVWMQLRAALAAMPPGKFISIAIFDHVFKSRPERPPIVVLGWKDWRGDEPDITVSRASAVSLPAMGAVASPSIPPNSFAPPAIATPTPIEAPAPSAQPSIPPPSASVSIAPGPKHTVAFAQMPDAVAAAIAAANAPIAQAPVAQAPVAQAPVEPPPVSVAITAPPVPEPSPAVQPAAPAWSAPTPAVVVDASAFAAPVAPVEPAPISASAPVADAHAANALSPAAMAALAPATVADLTAHVPEVAVESIPIELAQPVAPVPLVAPAPTPLVTPHAPVSVPPPRTAQSIPPQSQPSIPPTRHSAPPPSHVAPKPSQPSVQKKPSRQRGDDLLSEAFDALSDMAFLAETQQATDFASQVSKDLLHTPFVAIWLYDIDKHELVLDHCERAPNAKGRRARVVKGEVRADVVLRGTPSVLAHWEQDEPMSEAPMGPALFVSIALDRRLFGLLELHREVGDLPFEDDEEGTASYIAGQLAQFLADHSKRVGFQEEKPGAGPSRRR